ncbi:hypothetical protein QTH97_12140 [Variovorax sp. J22R24]|uniref:hypothetical protein n=1 Tax=Variovorax gracilis TaxID=3053502 RepID=UPI00257627AB|nr:hypothetical protein [Variovorax sp. J22R24]MDM0105689.1 hypothetical protein [Variovorax sp. J22R24]
MSELPPSIQVDLWNAFHPDTFLPSSGKRTLWVLRRGVLDDLAPTVESVLSRTWQPEPTENEQLVFRAVLEALATGRERLSEIVEFCNEIYVWPSVLGVADYLTGNLVAAVRMAALDVTSDREPRQERLPSWALVGTLLEALRATPKRSEAVLLPFTAALATVLGPKKGRLTGEHSRLLIQLYFKTGAGRRGSARESALHSFREAGPRSTPAGEDDDKVRKLLRGLRALQLIQLGEEEQEVRWTVITLRHLPPGHAASQLTSSLFK